MLMPLMQTVLFVVFPPDRRGTAMGVFGLVVAFAPAMGPTLVGWILSALPWQMLFAIMVPIIALDLILAFFLVRNVTTLTHPVIDGLSIALSSIGFGGLLYAFSMAGSLGWGDPVLVGTLAVAVASLVWFVVRQLRLAQPMLEFRVFKARAFTVAVSVASLAWCAFMGAATLLPMVMQNLAGFSALESGTTLMAGGIVMGVMSPVNGILFDRFGARGLTVAGLGLCLSSAVLFGMVGPGVTALYLGAAYALLMLGVSMVSMPLTTTALNSLPPHLIAHGTAMNNTVHTIAGALATAVLVAIMTTVSGGGESSPLPSGSFAGADAAFWVLAGVVALALVFARKAASRRSAAFLEEGEGQIGAIRSRRYACR